MDSIKLARLAAAGLVLVMLSSGRDVSVLYELYSSDPQASGDIFAAMMPPRAPLNVIKLSDHFGQYVLILTCACGHSRTANPEVLARIAGWDAALGDVIKRMRCSKCNAHGCTATVRPETKRDR